MKSPLNHHINHHQILVNPIKSPIPKTLPVPSSNERQAVGQHLQDASGFTAVAVEAMTHEPMVIFHGELLAYQMCLKTCLETTYSNVKQRIEIVVPQVSYLFFGCFSVGIRILNCQS